MIVGRRTFFLTAIAAATGGPYLMMDQSWPAAAKRRATSLLGPSAASQPGATSGPLDRVMPEGPIRFDQVLRMDVTPRWVVDNWPRVSTVVAELDLEGMRVALVTGSAVDDIAGSLTYYFDKHQQVQRITFRGFTGDERKLVNYCSHYFGLQPIPAVNSRLHLSFWNGVPRSALRVTHNGTIRADSPHTRMDVMLELNRPSYYYELTQEFQQILAQNRTLDS